MPTEILMPALSPTMEEGKLAKWLKKEGDNVKSGDVIAEIETDKATMEVEAVDEGTLGKILVPDGTENVAVNTPIAMILGEGEDAASLRQGGAPSRRQSPSSPPRQKAPSQHLRRGPNQPRKPQRPRRPRPATPSRLRRVVPEPEVPEGTAIVTMTMREALARRDGRGNAPRRRRLRHGRGSRRISGRL